MARYKIINVAENGAVAIRHCDRAPDPSTLRRGSAARFSSRYYPSKKAWRVFDEHNRRSVTLAQGYITLRPQLAFETPSEEAAMMWMQLMRTKQ